MAISNASNQIVKVNLIPGIIPSVLHLSQYDTGAGRPITFSVYDGSQAFTIPSGVSIAFEGTKPDGKGFSFTCSKSDSNALLTNYTNQMTALPGKIMCQLVFTDTSGGRVGSLPVLMVVTPAGINGDTVISDSDIEAIVAAQNQYAVLNARLDAAVDQVNTMTNEAIDQMNTTTNKAVDQMNTKANDLQNQYAVTNAKLDTAISAATQDSEVQDIRVKADGTSATTAGNAVREQITELKSAIDDMVVVTVGENLTNPAELYGATIDNTTGAINKPNNYYVCSGHIPCTPGETLYILWYVGTNDIRARKTADDKLAFYKEDGTFISIGYNEDSYTVPELAAYCIQQGYKTLTTNGDVAVFRVPASSLNGRWRYYTETKTLEYSYTPIEVLERLNTIDDITELKSAINEIDETVCGEKNYIDNEKLVTAAGASNGELTPDNNFSTSEFIPLSDIGASGQTVKVVYGTIGENSMFAVYDSNKNFLNSWSLSSSATERSFTFSYASYTNPTYVRFSFQNGYSARIAIMSGATEIRTAWAARQNGGISNDVDNLKNAVNEFPESYMETGKYMDYSMENRLNPADCELNTIVMPSSGNVDAYNGYFTTDFIPIRTGETLYFYRIDTKEIKTVRMFAAYDADKNVISNHGSTSEVRSIAQSDNMAYIKASLSYVASDYARTPEDIAALANANPAYIPGYGNAPVIKTQYLERHTIWVRSTDTEAQIIQKFVDAFNTGNTDVYFERATYQFGTELAKVNTDYGMIHNEIPIGNGCRYYFNGSTLIATIDLTQHPAIGNDEFYCNFFGCQRRPSSYELHDGVLIATDTRYVVHDESSALSGSYKHLYQNMELHYHTNLRQEKIRKCIGGGTGASGVVEIVGCKFTTDGTDSCVSFHGNATDVVRAEFDLNIRNSWFSNSIRAGALSVHQTARLFYCGNSSASAPATYENWTVTDFLNEVRT